MRGLGQACVGRLGVPAKTSGAAKQLLRPGRGDAQAGAIFCSLRPTCFAGAPRLPLLVLPDMTRILMDLQILKSAAVHGN